MVWKEETERGVMQAEWAKKVIDLRMHFLFLRRWNGIHVCIALVWDALTHPLNSTLHYATVNISSIMVNTWCTWPVLLPMLLSLWLLLALSFASAATHMGKEMMHHSPPHSPNYNLINTFLIFTLFHSHITAKSHSRMCALGSCVCLFICSFVHLLLRFACFQSCRKHTSIRWYKMRQ